MDLYIFFIILFVFTELWTVYLFHFLYKRRLQCIIEKFEKAVALRESLRHANKDEQEEKMKELKETSIYSELHTIANSSSYSKISQEKWEEIERTVHRIYPNFKKALYSTSDLSEIEYQICLLIKMQLCNIQISRILSKSKQAITSARSRLYKKTFHKDGSAKEWDLFINTL